MARALKRDKTDILTRAERWELTLSNEQEQLILRVSGALREYYAWALEREAEADKAYRDQLAAHPGTKPVGKRFLSEIDLYSVWKDVRTQDARDGLFRGTVPANWVLETFKSAVGAYRSFFALAKNGDRDARPPRAPTKDRFAAIPGCSAFSVRKGRVSLAPDIFGRETLSFSVPEEYQARMLARSSRVAKFVITRDERDLRKPGRYWISVAYEIPKPEQKPFRPEEAVYIALGASSIGIVSPRGEEVIPLWRSDKHWKPRIDRALEHLDGKPFNAQRPGLTKGSKQWRKLRKSADTMYRTMARQQTQDRREVVARDLLEKEIDRIVSGHGVHFVITDLVVRSKDGKLADGDDPLRGGALGLNWSAQNTGTIGYLARWLEAKAPEFGGSVRRHTLGYEALPSCLGRGHENKIPIARALRDDFLRTMAA